ncbi:hypothetical protein HUT08_08105 [Streptomyces buecherae]|uniref:Uncharacterized protein n=1 Tax=Streptomyces buecherae TaxID=2763006 RepID=A0A7H8N4S9_9ACTN|nr:hypothetical protein HUT08_08105 [Streptomyces buecherae]
MIRSICSSLQSVKASMRSLCRTVTREARGRVCFQAASARVKFAAFHPFSVINCRTSATAPISPSRGGCSRISRVAVRRMSGS